MSPMRVFTSRRSALLPVAIVAAAVAGCADQSAVGPRAQDPSLLTSTITSIITTTLGTSSTTSGSSGRKTFSVGPYSTVIVALGDHQLYLPAGSVCDPAASSYGPSEWDKPCQPLRSPVTITAAWWTDAVTGHPRIEFEPALRFVPTSDASKWVTLTMKDQYLLNLQLGQSPVIAWRDSGGNWVDESLTDATLRTITDWLIGSVSRRIKHFSGYMVTARSEE
jgi:hypothetical protein